MGFSHQHDRTKNSDHVGRAPTNQSRSHHLESGCSQRTKASNLQVEDFPWFFQKDVPWFSREILGDFPWPFRAYPAGGVRGLSFFPPNGQGRCSLGKIPPRSSHEKKSDFPWNKPSSELLGYSRILGNFHIYPHMYMCIYHVCMLILGLGLLLFYPHMYIYIYICTTWMLVELSTLWQWFYKVAMLHLDS